LSVGLSDWLEQMRQKLAGNPDAAMAHDDADSRAVQFERHENLAAFRGELDGLRQDVPEDLSKPAGSPTSRAANGSAWISIAIRLASAAGFRLSSASCNGVIRNTGWVSRRTFPVVIREISRRSDQLVLRSRIALDDFDRASALVDWNRATPQHSRASQNRAERGS
jgi:hypothetical protein